MGCLHFLYAFVVVCLFEVSNGVLCLDCLWFVVEATRVWLLFSLWCAFLASFVCLTFLG